MAFTDLKHASDFDIITTEKEHHLVSLCLTERESVLTIMNQ